MKILALDSSGLVASVAVTNDDQLIAEYTINYKKTHSQTLLPMLDEIKKQIDLDLNTIDRIAIAYGPGSFTGLRIGSSTAKGLGLALNKPIVEVPTLHALAYNLYGVNQLVCPIMDARRGQVYTGIFSFKENHKLKECEFEFDVIQDQDVIMIDELMDSINRIGKAVMFVGDAIPVYKEQILSQAEVPVSFAPAGFNRQRAATVALLSTKGYPVVSAEAHRPDYLRLSQAERERISKEEK